MRVLVGTSGYSYKEWKGSFYPEKLSPKKMLAYYAERLPTVEINNTFYRMPKTAVVEAWAEQVPDGFSFVIKASRRITHLQKMVDVDEPLGYLYETTSALGEKLGAILFQFPPFLRRDVERLKAFLDALPDERKVALEFRHESWLDDAVYDVIRTRDFVTLCNADTEDGLEAPLDLAPWGYLRLRRETYDDAELAAWATRVQAQAWSDAFVFFKHEERAPDLATRLIAHLAD